MVAPVTSIYAAIAGIIIVGLAFRVVQLRRRERVPLGYGENKHLRRAVRVHANATETIPIILILMILLEFNGGAAWQLHLFGNLMILGRLIHAWWLSRFSGKSFGRTWGTVLTWGVLVALAFANISIAFS
ncbi:MAG: MAPEG family protein [Acidiferrobacterales bacterium]